MTFHLNLFVSLSNTALIKYRGRSQNPLLIINFIKLLIKLGHKRMKEAGIAEYIIGSTNPLGRVDLNTYILHSLHTV